ncbi:MAG: hypothetical protein ACI4TH_01085 [Candidatus Ornithomonoglobus sp.]
MTDKDIEARIKKAFNNVHADDETKERVFNRGFKTVKKKRNVLPVIAAGTAAAAVAVFAAVHSINYEKDIDIAAETAAESPAETTEMPVGTLLPSETEIPVTAAPELRAEKENHTTEYYKQQALQSIEDDPKSTPAIKPENGIQPNAEPLITNPPAAKETETPEPEVYNFRIASSVSEITDMPVISAVLGVHDDGGGLEYVYTEVTDRVRLSGDMKYNGSAACPIGDGSEMRLYNYTGDNGRYANVIVSDDSTYVNEVLESPEVNNSSVSDIPVDDSKPDEVYFFYMNAEDNSYVVNTHRLTKQENMDLLYSLGGE